MYLHILMCSWAAFDAFILYSGPGQRAATATDLRLSQKENQTATATATATTKAGHKPRQAKGTHTHTHPHTVELRAHAYIHKFSHSLDEGPAKVEGQMQIHKQWQRGATKPN